MTYPTREEFIASETCYEELGLDAWYDLVEDVGTAMSMVCDSHPLADPWDILHAVWDASPSWEMPWCHGKVWPRGTCFSFRVSMSEDQSEKFGASPMPFGKYKGRRMDDVPLDYLNWLRQTRDFVEKLDTYWKSQRILDERREAPKRLRGEYINDEALT